MRDVERESCMAMRLGRPLPQFYLSLCLGRSGRHYDLCWPSVHGPHA